MDNISMFLNAQDLSLQEMLDTDMKIEIDNVFGPSEMSLSLSELPPLDLDESLGGPTDMPMWFTSSGVGILSAAHSDSSNSNFNLDLVGNDGAGKMVDPTSVIPCMNGGGGGGGSIQYFNRNAYIIEDSPGSLSSPDIDEEPFTPPEAATGLKFVTSLSVLNPIRQNIRVASFTTRGEDGGPNLNVNVVKAVPIVQANGAKLLGNGVAKMQHIQISGVRTLNGSGGGHVQQQQQQIHHVQQAKKQTFGVAKQQGYHHQGDSDYEDHRPYPKPAYSYSCLIAMALKNSAVGSLPVSEIYNFMCEHFPYFKTAPNGWKNSVRHNLSLNKCFEKIEKPAGNGSQRKGCLWAMNPAKIAKMDEEVQKWSKKDPMAIKKAMINPENLELLERGELKREFVGLAPRSPGGSLSGGDESDEEDDVMSPATPVEQFVDISSVTTAASSDEGSLNDYDVEVADTLYDELQRDEKLNLGVTFTSHVQPKELLGISLSASSVSSSSPSRLLQAQQPSFANKRAKISTSIHGNYVYKPMTGGWDSSDRKRKPPLLLRGSNGSIGSSLIKVDDSL